MMFTRDKRRSYFCRTIPRAVHWAAGVAILVAALATNASAGQVAPTMYNWNTATSSPTMMNNDTGYCWLSGVYGNFTTPSDYVNLTFDSNWNWIFTGATSDAIIYAIALCQPWSSLTNRPGQAYFGYELTGVDSSQFMYAPDESMCGIEGIGGPIAPNIYMGSVCTGCASINGDMNLYASHGQGELWGQCAHFGGGSQPHPSYTSATSGQTLNLGSSLTQMCVLEEIDAEQPSSGWYAWLDLDGNNNYQLQAYGVGVGMVYASCTPIPQP